MASPPPVPKRKRSIITDALLHPGSWRNKRPRPGSPTDSGVLAPGVIESHISTQTAAQSLSPSGPPGPSGPHTQGGQALDPEIIVQSSPAATNNSSTQNSKETSWTGLEKALQALHITTKICPPLHSAIDSVKSCLHVFEDAAKRRKDYDELACELKAMVELLDKSLPNAVSKEVMDTIESIAKKILTEMESVDKRKSWDKIRQVLERFGEEEDLIRRYHRIQQLFRQLLGEASMGAWIASSKHFVNTQLESLRPVKLASFDSEISIGIGRRSCTENTRTRILSDTMKWADDPNGAKIYWMNGMAGTGKTTIAYSLCQALEDAGQLAASFFCTRTSPDCRDAERIVPTIAYQLARHSAPFRRAISGALDKDADAGSRDFRRQFERLLSKPLPSIQESIANNLVIVVDALDECSDPYIVGIVLATLFGFAPSCPIKFFVTSRPEPVIRESMMAGITERDRPNSILYLHEIEKSLVQADIKLYLEDELKNMLPAHQDDIEELAEQAGNLFIYAATAVRYIQPPGKPVNRKQRLKTILAVDNKLNDGLSGIDKLYTTILNEAINDEALNVGEREAMKAVLWTAVCVFEPVLIGTLTKLTGLDDEEFATAVLQPLRSVLHVSEHSHLITTLHASFPDYMFSRNRSGEFFCDKSNHSQLLVRSCLHTMKAELCFNICEIESSFIPDEEIPDLQQRANKCISPDLFYACRFWADHLTLVGLHGPLADMIHEFLSNRLLFWMEVLNLKRCMVNGAMASTMVHMWVRGMYMPTELIALAHDAQTFVGNYAAHQASSSTPHIYISALPLSSPTNRIRLIYLPRFKGLVQATGTLMNQIDQACVQVWSSYSPIRSASFSSDRKYVVLGDEVGTISVRYPHTGEKRVEFPAHRKAVTSVAFSNDAALIVSSSHDYTLCIWNAIDGSPACSPFRGHTRRVNSAAFSFDGVRLVSSSDDHTIRTWAANDPSHSQLVLNGDASPVKSAVFSPNGLQIASCSGNRSVHIWDALSGALLHHLIGHTRSVACVRYSPCGTSLYSGANDGTIRIWDTRNGTPIGNPLRGHSDCVTSIAASPEGDRIASGSLDRTVRVWHRKSGLLMAGPFEGHTDSVRSVDFSADGARIITASDDKTVRVWNAQGNTQLETKADPALAFPATIYRSAISPCGVYIATAYNNGPIMIWNLQSGARQSVQFRRGGKESVVLLAFSPDGTHIFAACADGLMWVLNRQRGELIGDPCPFSPYKVIWDGLITLSPDGRSVISTGTNEGIVADCRDQALALWDLRAKQLVRTIEARTGGRFSQIVFSSDSARFTTCIDCRLFDVWVSSTGQHIAGPFDLNMGSGLTGRMIVSPDCTHAISHSFANEATVYNLIDGRYRTFSALEDYNLRNLLFSPNKANVGLFYANFIGVYSITEEKWVNSLVVPTKWIVHAAAFITSESLLVLCLRDCRAEIEVYRVRAGIASASASHYLSEESPWVLDQNSNKVICIPPELRDRFPPSSRSNFMEHSWITVDYDDILVGDQWSQCYIGRHP